MSDIDSYFTKVASYVHAFPNVAYQLCYIYSVATKVFVCNVKI